MTLTTNGKNYIAQELGIGNCFVASGMAWIAEAVDGKTVNETGGTASIVGRLVNTTLYARIRLTSPNVKTFYYSDLKTANDNTDITLSDVANWIVPFDGDPVSESKYCAAVVTPTPTPTPTPAPGGLAGEFEFLGVPVGIPTVSLDLSSLIMRQATDYHFEMNDVIITNTSGWPVYLAMEVKLFKGSLSSCPSTGYVFDGLDRTSAKGTRTKTLAPGERGTYDTDYYQPASIIGTHTVCLLVHGAWTKAEIDAETKPITG